MSRPKSFRKVKRNRAVLGSALLAGCALLLGSGLLASVAEAKPYPRHDHLGLTENRRQRPHFRKDDYTDQQVRRRDNYVNRTRPTLSTLEKNPEPEVTFERVQTKRTEYTEKRNRQQESQHGKGWLDAHPEDNPATSMEPLDASDEPRDW